MGSLIFIEACSSSSLIRDQTLHRECGVLATDCQGRPGEEFTKSKSLSNEKVLRTRRVCARTRAMRAFE